MIFLYFFLWKLWVICPCKTPHNASVFGCYQDIAMLLLRYYARNLVPCYMVTTYFCYVRTVECMKCPTLRINKCIIRVFEVLFFLLEVSVWSHYSHYLLYMTKWHKYGMHWYSGLQIWLGNRKTELLNQIFESMYLNFKQAWPTETDPRVAQRW